MINIKRINSLKREVQVFSEMNKIQCLYQDNIDIDKQFEEV